MAKTPTEIGDDSWQLKWLPDSVADNRFELYKAVRNLRFAIDQGLGVSPLPKDGADPNLAWVTIHRITADCQWLNSRLPDLLSRVGIKCDGFPIPEPDGDHIDFTARKYHRQTVEALGGVQVWILDKILSDDLPKHWQLVGDRENPVLPDYPITNLKHLSDYLTSIYDTTAGTDLLHVVCATLANANAFFFHHYRSASDRPTFAFSFDSMTLAAEELRRAITEVDGRLKSDDLILTTGETINAAEADILQALVEAGGGPLKGEALAKRATGKDTADGRFKETCAVLVRRGMVVSGSGASSEGYRITAKGRSLLEAHQKNSRDHSV